MHVSPTHMQACTTQTHMIRYIFINNIFTQQQIISNLSLKNQILYIVFYLMSTQKIKKITYESHSLKKHIEKTVFRAPLTGCELLVQPASPEPPLSPGMPRNV